MKIGIPNGLLYYKYHPFIDTFFSELGEEIIVSPKTNKIILDDGIKYCVDEACLPVKLFHGHVAYLRNKCDLLFIPRIMQLSHREFICPKFCGLPEMVKNTIPDLPEILSGPIYGDSKKNLYKWVKATGNILKKNTLTINSAFNKALDSQKKFKFGINNKEYKLKVAFVGHPYNICDEFSNMDLVKKLNNMNIGVITDEFVDESIINSQCNKLFKKPFWTFARRSFGFSTYLAEKREIDGIIYISSFACGIDSIVIELIKDTIGDFPFMVLKIDEQTGEAGLDTRIEAFADMLERRCEIENNFSSYGKHLSCS